MSYVLVCLAALAAAALTFFSGFGLGTLLLPVFALLFPMEHAVALTAVVHFLNGLLKLALVGRHADLGVVLRFGMPAIVAAFAGAGALLWLADHHPLWTYSVLGRNFMVQPIQLVVGIILLVLAVAEGLPWLHGFALDRRYLPLGGLLSGFFGGLAGTQGAFRSVFLLRAGLSKEAFVATGVVVATLIDAARLILYGQSLWSSNARIDYGILTAAVLAASIGTVLGNRFLKKITMTGVQRVVVVMLVVFAVGLMSGVL